MPFIYNNFFDNQFTVYNIYMYIHIVLKATVVHVIITQNMYARGLIQALYGFQMIFLMAFYTRDVPIPIQTSSVVYCKTLHQTESEVRLFCRFRSTPELTVKTITKLLISIYLLTHYTHVTWSKYTKTCLQFLTNISFTHSHMVLLLITIVVKNVTLICSV